MDDTYTEGSGEKSTKSNLKSEIFSAQPMIRISIYHWLPIADNMLSEIEKRLRAMPSDHVSDVQVERDAVRYHTVFPFNRDFRSHAVFPVHGKINQRGFCQHVLNIAPVAGLPLNVLLNDIVPEMKQTIAELVFIISPDAVRNKLAILRGGITPFQQFLSITLDPPTDQAARAFLVDAGVAAIALDDAHADTMRAGFNLPDTQIFVPPCDSASAAFANEKGDSFLFYSDSFHPDEWATHDSVLYKYCALVLYVRFVDHSNSILKQARDHVIPLRRRLALALQGNIGEHYESLTQIKRYLTYVNIKLPLVQKVIHHLQVTHNAETFAAKIATFDEPAKVFGYPAIRSIEETFWQPHYLVERIKHEPERLQALYDEDVKEIQIISSELSQVLEGSLLSEQLQVSMRALDASQAALEIGRSAKNLANANKWMNVLVIALFGVLIALGVGIGWAPSIAFGALLLVIGYLVTAFALYRHSAYFRLVIPVRANLPSDALAAWIASHRLHKNKTDGNQITCTWREPICVRTFVLSDSPSQSLARSESFTHTFQITVDLQRRGFLNTITLETEHLTALFDPHDLVKAIFSALRASGCLSDVEESSLFATALSQLEIPLEARLPALNKLLTLPANQVNQIVTTGASTHEDSISKQDLFLMQDLNAQPRAYKDWLKDILSNPAQQDSLALLGQRNVRQKLMLIEHLEEAHVKRT